MFALEFAQVLNRVIDDTFPPINDTFCYGSKAFPQKINKADTKPQKLTKKEPSNEEKPGRFDQIKKKLSRSMMDCIFVVDNPRQWHAKNLLSNPMHYSLLMRYSGAKTITKLQSIGGGILYNPYIDIEWKKYHQTTLDLQIKYGVISTSCLISDLLYWDKMYVAGRLHKPTMMIQNGESIHFSNDIMKVFGDTAILSKKLDEIYNRSHDESENIPDVQLKDAMLLNWDFAVRVALLLLICDKLKDGEVQKFAMENILMKIVSLSYLGDDRMEFGEDKHKIMKIVNGSKDYLLKIYKPILEQYIAPNSLENGNEEVFECYVSIDDLMQRLPRNLVHGINERDGDSIETAIQDSMAKIIKSSSRKQIIKSFLATDIDKIALYFAQKVYKKIRSGYDCG